MIQSSETLQPFFLPLSQRSQHTVFFCRIAGYSPTVAAFIRKYYQDAHKSGVVIDKNLPNPTNENLQYFSKTLGSQFALEQEFLTSQIQKWIPRLRPAQSQVLAASLTSMLKDMQKQGKNNNILRNAYIKFMCWLYYRFERIARQLLQEQPPKILYFGTISISELQIISILSVASADCVLVEPEGDQVYQKLDPSNRYSFLYQSANMTKFPADFSLKQIQNDIRQEQTRQNIYGVLPNKTPCTNAWIEKPAIQAVLTPPTRRGGDTKLFYNSFIVQYGVSDATTAVNNFFSLYKSLQKDKRSVCIVNGGIPIPLPKETAEIQRKNYQDTTQMAAGLARNIRFPENIELERLMKKAFLDCVLDRKDNMNIQKQLNQAVCLLCLLKRYQKILFSNWTDNNMPIFIQFGKCAAPLDALFLQMLSRLPVDVLILLPDLRESCAVQSEVLLEIHYTASQPMNTFPTEQIRITTAARQAEQELDTILYQDSGFYRNQQYQKAEIATLQPTYEEISILWDEEVKYRPGFSTVEDIVTLPVLLEKVCGVKDGVANAYWNNMKKLLTPDTIFIQNLPWITEPSPAQPFAVRFLRNGKLLREDIKAHKTYSYGILRPAMQEHLLDQLQRLLDLKLISGTYQNGTEYTIISRALYLPKEVLRLIQKFDFTRKNPKLIFVLSTEETLSLEDSITAAFLHFIGFDILFFVPTGYQSIEKYFQKPFANEHQIGEYMYDLSVPFLQSIRTSGLRSIKKFFGRKE